MSLWPCWMAFLSFVFSVCSSLPALAACLLSCFAVNLRLKRAFSRPDMVEVSWQTPPLCSECDYLIGVWDLRRVVSELSVGRPAVGEVVLMERPTELAWR